MKIDKKIEISIVNPITLILFLTFFIAKIFDKIDWAWIWVFSPLWIPITFVFLITLFCVIGIISTSAIETFIKMIRQWK